MHIIELESLKRSLSSRAFSVLAIAALLFSMVPIPAYAIIYDPGTTLDPTCLPTDVNCGVQAPITGTAATSTFQTPIEAQGTIQLSASTTPTDTTAKLYNVGNVLYWNGSAVSGISGLSSLNGLVTSTQTFATSTSLNTFGFSSSGSVHTLTLPSNIGFFANDAGYFTLSSWYATTTDAVTQGATNLYYSDVLARDALSVSATGGLAYSTTTGIFTFSTSTLGLTTTNALSWAGNTLTSTVNGVAAAAGILYANATTDGLISTTTQTFAGNKTFNNNLTVSGTTTASKLLWSAPYDVSDPLPDASVYHGMFAHRHDLGTFHGSHAGNWLRLVHEDTAGDASVTGALTIGAVTTLSALGGGLLTTDAFGKVSTTSLTSVNAGALVGDTLRWSGSGWNATSSLFIASSGNIGIGTTNPFQKFTVIGSADISSLLTAQNLVATSTSVLAAASASTLGVSGLTSLQSLTAAGFTSLQSLTAAGTSTFNATSTFNGLIDATSKRILRVATPTDTTDAANKGYVDAFVQGLSWQSPVIDFATTSVASTTGDRYIIASGASGFATCALNDICQNTGVGAWTATTPATSTTIHIQNLATTYTFNGSLWVSLGSSIQHNSLLSIQGGDGSNYYHLGLTDWQALTDINYAQLAHLRTIGTPTFQSITATSSLTSSVQTSLASTTLSGSTLATGTTTLSSVLNLSALTGGLLTTNVSGVVSTTSLASLFGGTQGQTITFNSAGNPIATSSLYIASNGNVGIGTASPSVVKLDISGDVRIQGPDGYNVANEKATLYLGDLAGNRPAGILAERGVGVKIGVYKSGGSGSFGSQSLDAIFIADETGNVGIGTTTPNNKLAVNGGITIASSTPSVTSHALYNQGGTLYWNGSAVGSGGASLTGSTGQVAYFSGANTAVGTSSLFIASSGNIGIGTANPANKLSVEGTFGVLGDILSAENPNLNTGTTTATNLGTAIGGTDTVIKYTGVGSATLTIPDGVTEVQYLIVGGGGGGSANHGAGGGGGGFRTGTTTVSGGQNIVVVVGDGGAPGAYNSANVANSTAGSDGGDSSFNSITAGGGGGGGAGYNSTTPNGRSGRATNGSGGGGGGSGTAGTGGTGNSAGKNGGAGTSNGTAGNGGGGGGAGAPGAAATAGSGGSGQGTGGNGGNGLASSITGSSVTHAGGGGGGSWNATAGTGGAGGGGDGNSTNGTTDDGFPGDPNTGGGGGGAGVGGNPHSGGKGGSGIVVVRFTTVAAATSVGARLAVDTSGNTTVNGKLFIMQGTATSSLIGLTSGGTRMRLTAGQSDTQDNDQGANVDLHSVANGGNLDLVAGRSGALKFWTSPSAQTAQSRMLIDENGNVGIGVTTPTNKLHLAGALTLDSATLATTTNALYNQSGTLYWNGATIGQPNGTLSGDMTYWNGSSYVATSLMSFAPTAINNQTNGVTWTSRTSASNSYWNAVTYSNGLYVAVADSGGIMTSPDGITWTSRTSPVANRWRAVTYGNGLFVAVSDLGTGNRVMTSPDGITWTSRVSAADSSWRGVTYGNGVFVAVAVGGTGNRVMISSDGITWTGYAAATNLQWISVTYGNGLFAAVSYDGTIMTSPNGTAWTSRTSPAANQWLSVTYGNGLFVAVSNTGTGNRVMTSPDGITWTSRTSTADIGWTSVTYGNGVFAAVGYSATNNGIMTSTDGVNWTARTTPVANDWRGVTSGGGLFVAVSSSGTGNRVMTSPAASLSVGTLSLGTASAPSETTLVVYGNTGIGMTAPTHKLHVKAVGNDIAKFEGANSTSCTFSGGGVIACTSDENLKNEIIGMSASSSLATILGLKPSSFVWNSDSASTTQYGFIAQEVELELPGLVVTDAGSGYKSVSMLGMMPYVVSAIQDIAHIGDTFKSNIIAWFADTVNGIGNFFAKKVFTDEICLTDSNGDYVCLTADDVRDIGTQKTSTSATATTTDAEQSSTESQSSGDAPSATAGVTIPAEATMDTSDEPPPSHKAPEGHSTAGEAAPPPSDSAPATSDEGASAGEAEPTTEPELDTPDAPVEPEVGTPTPTESTGQAESVGAEPVAEPTSEPVVEPVSPQAPQPTPEATAGEAEPAS